MQVKLISVTKPLITIEKDGNALELTPEELIVYVARVSSPGNQNSIETSEKLLNYLIKHGHWSPFEMVDMTVEIKTSRAIAQQILRHKSFCVSGDNLLTFELPGAKLRGKRSSYKKTVKEIYDKFRYGNSPIKRKGLCWDINGILPEKRYSIPELSRVLGAHEENIRSLIYKGKLNSIRNNQNQHVILGKDIVRCFNYSHNQYQRMPANIQKLSLRCYDEDKKTFVTTKIKNIWSNGYRDVYKIELSNGYSISCTDDHLFLTREGYTSIREGLDVKLGKNNLVSWDKTKELFVACNGTTVPWNKGKTGYSLRLHSEETREKMRKSSRKGSASNLWRGGVSRSERLKISDYLNKYRTKLYREADFTCGICSVRGGKLHLHHKIPVFEDISKAYDLSNIQVVCEPCHDEHHKIKGHAKIWREKHIGNTLTAEYSKVVKIEYLGREEVFDLEVESPFHNFVCNGIVVHNCFQEFSQRYAEVTDFEPVQIRRQAEKNRQSSEENFDPIIYFEGEHEISAYEEIEAFIAGANDLYQRLVKAGVARECARMVLPLTTQSTLYMKGSIRSWIHYFLLRCKQDTQLEHRDIAFEILDLFRPHFPKIYNAQFKGTEYEKGLIERGKIIHE